MTENQRTALLFKLDTARRHVNTLDETAHFAHDAITEAQELLAEVATEEDGGHQVGHADQADTPAPAGARKRHLRMGPPKTVALPVTEGQEHLDQVDAELSLDRPPTPAELRVATGSVHPDS